MDSFQIPVLGHVWHVFSCLLYDICVTIKYSRKSAHVQHNQNSVNKYYLHSFSSIRSLLFLFVAIFSNFSKAFIISRHRLCCSRFAPFFFPSLKIEMKSYMEEEAFTIHHSISFACVYHNEQ